MAEEPSVTSDNTDDAAADLAREIRRRRKAAGLSQPRLAKRIGYTHQYVSLAERIGQNLPSQELVRALDAALNAEGALLALRDQAKAEQRARRPSLSQPASRVRVHHETAVGIGADLGSETESDAFDRLAAVLARPRGADRAVVEHLAAVLARQRALEDDLGPRAVLPAVLTEVDLLDTLARQALGATRSRLIKLTGEYHQFLGWMREDSGEYTAALGHYDRAMDAAQETDDANMVTSVLSLKSHLAWSQHDTGRAVGLAEAGQRDIGGVSPGVLALITQQQARGHALDGDAEPVERLMNRTEMLTAKATERPDDEPPWVYFHGPDRVLFQRGVAYLELGRHNDALELLIAARVMLPANYRRDHGRYAANIATAAALDGQLDRAASAAREALAIAVETGSAHTITELRRGRQALARWPHEPAVTDFDEALHTVTNETR